MKNDRIKAIVRLAVQVVVLANMMLTLAGKNPIPFDETTFTEWLTVAMTGISSVWIWWKNNNITSAACEAQGTLEQIKGKMQSNIDVEAIGDEDNE